MSIKRKYQNEIQIKSVNEELKQVTFYASIFGNVDLVNDVIVSGSFKKTISERKDKVRFLYEHDYKTQVGKIISIEEDEKGLLVTAQLLNTQKGNEVWELIKNDCVQFSIGFSLIKGSYDSKTGIYYIQEVKLYEVSAVAFPANDETYTVGYKSNDIELEYESIRQTKNDTIEDFSTVISELKQEIENLKNSTLATEAAAEQFTDAVEKAVKNEEVVNIWKSVFQN